ncbi:hypothetical protein MMC08_000430 [Hypocenomyce scalaris]|nr:hypothetical protein [Hypocenomyce scalaris]
MSQDEITSVEVASVEFKHRPERNELKIGAKKDITDLRQRIMRSRLHLREKRKELRDERARASDLETDFMQSIRESWELGTVPDKESLFELYATLQETRNLLGPLEDDYDQEEDGYNAAEFELDEKEERLYLKKPDSSSPNDYQGSFPGSIPTDSTASSLTSHKSESSESHKAIVFEYWSRVGDGNLVREKLEDLRFEHAQILNNMRVRDNLDVEPYTENVEFLAAFKEKEAEVLVEMLDIKADVKRLEQGALEKGIRLDKNSSMGLVQPRMTIDSGALKEKEQSLQRAQSDSSLPHFLARFKICTGARARINSWILSNLGHSRLERVQHKNILFQALRIDSIDHKTWKRYVFENWDSDDGGESPTGSGEDVPSPEGATRRKPSLDVLRKGQVPSPSGRGHRASKAATYPDTYFYQGLKSPAFDEVVNGLLADCESNVPAIRDSAFPYSPGGIEIDVLPEYQSRSA